MNDLQAWVELARGPLFRACLAFLILGLLRHAVITVWEMAAILYRAGDKVIPWRQVAAATLKWLFLAGQLKHRIFFGLVTLVFHVSILLTPIFLAGHISLWKRALGLSWPSISNNTADVLTITTLLTAMLLVVLRALAQDSRALSRFQDYALPLVIAVPFATGFLVMHPVLNPCGYEAMLLMHVMSANFLLVLIPLTKLSHMILLPATQLVSELAWHFPPDAGSRVAAALGKEKEPI